jgi:hypothetical protein
VSWFKLDDQFPHHPKVMKVGPAAAWLYVAGGCYCARYLTDGKIPKATVPTLTTLADVDQLAASLVAADLWHDQGDEYEVHDYLTYNPSQAKVHEERAAARERRQNEGRTGGLRSRERRANVSSPVPDVLSEHARKRATPPPDDFQLDDGLLEWARRACPGVDVVRERDHWIEWCRANGKTYKDHRAAFQTWCRNALRWGRTSALDPTDLT